MINLKKQDLSHTWATIKMLRGWGSIVTFVLLQHG